MWRMSAEIQLLLLVAAWSWNVISRNLKMSRFFGLFTISFRLFPAEGWFALDYRSSAMQNSDVHGD